jgi:GDPmannose 4,6-dehydratase
MLQQETPDDFVIATGETHTVKEFIEVSFKEIGVDIEWKGENENEKGYDAATGKVRIEIDKNYYRPTEVDLLIGDPSKAEKILGWKPKVTFEDLVKIMVKADCDMVKKKGY